MAALGRLSRVRVRCVSRLGTEEETLVVPVPGATGWTVARLLERIRERARDVPPEDLEELELDSSQGGRLFPEDPLEDVLQDGDLLVCTVARRPRARPQAAKASGKGGKPEQPVEQSPSGNAALAAGYARVFGEDRNGEEGAAESDESPTPPAVGGAYHIKGGSALGSRPPSHFGLWRRQRPPLLAAPPAPPAAGGRSRSPAGRTRCEQAPPSVSAPTLEGREGKWPPLLRAAYECNLEAVEELLRQGADVNCTMPGAGQKTPIYYAIRFEVPELVRLLLGHPDVDVHREMRLGRGGSWTTPLEAAREAGPTSGVYQAFAERGHLGPRPEPPRRAPLHLAGMLTARTGVRGQRSAYEEAGTAYGGGGEAASADEEGDGLPGAS